MIDFIVYSIAIALLIYAAKQSIILFMLNRLKITMQNENNEDQTRKFKMKLIAQIVIPSVLSIGLTCFGVS